MIKRAALARALVLDPDIVFLDEPTAGLDPIGAAEFDQLILKLRDTLGLTVFMVTHDLDSLVTITDRIAVLGNRRVLVDGTFAELKSFDHPWVRAYFQRPARRALHLRIGNAMESRANYAVIGGFVLVMLMIGLAFLGWLSNAGQTQRQADVRVIFSGAVTGLSTGSAVLFNGIKIGEVRDLRLDEKDPRTVIAIVRVNRDVPIKTDTRATLSYQGLTGTATLQLEGGSRNAPGLFDAATDGIPTMPAEISPFQDILESARNVLTRADSAMAAIDDFITENGPAFNRTVNNVEKFSAALADNSDNISKAMGSISTAADSIGYHLERSQGCGGASDAPPQCGRSKTGDGDCRATV